MISRIMLIVASRMEGNGELVDQWSTFQPGIRLS